MGMINAWLLVKNLGKRTLTTLASTVASLNHLVELINGQTVLPLQVIFPTVKLVTIWISLSPSLLVRLKLLFIGLMVSLFLSPIVLFVGLAPSFVRGRALFLIGLVVSLLLS
jgi:hypothetical protein